MRVASNQQGKSSILLEYIVWDKTEKRENFE